ncbi:hypothetical protein F7734_52875 [Scytonema sp. UIC 10036]|uniref:hypothetical protein n=1 Tax=Scytonema sp. UIC 10036 TaxID=2304196 RepID=UPI0012DACDAC|nr:hypothetical protein [Scytonema sp. UIC 10036]MUH00510.1 hypothetical protein [Scytonema sp. UIC 10036]
MFATFTTITAKNIATTETLISDLEQQLQVARQELAQFQQQQQAEQTAKSAAETALEMVRKARKLVQVAYGDAAVEEFNRALVEDEAVARELPQVEDSNAGSEAMPTDPTPSAETDVPATVTVEAVEVDSQEAQEGSESTAEIVLPTPDAIGSMKKNELVAWLKRCELPAGGTVREMRNRLSAHAMSYRNPNTQAA